jgi:CRISPR/Cas system-associated protein endoribonuclease Cas2
MELNICKSEGCNRQSAKGRKICNTCKTRQYRKNNLLRASYIINRSNAIARGKEFTISFEYYTQFCFETEYLQKKGRTAKSYSIDRIKDELGYVEGNIRILTVGENSSKENTRRKSLNFELARNEKIFKVVEIASKGSNKKKDDEEVPF